jgi:hypothetical protein
LHDQGRIVKTFLYPGKSRIKNVLYHYFISICKYFAYLYKIRNILDIDISHRILKHAFTVNISLKMFEKYIKKKVPDYLPL